MAQLLQFNGIIRQAAGCDGRHPLSRLWMAIFLAVWFTPVWCLAQATEPTVNQRTHYLTTRVDGLTIFYREAGPKDAPTLVLLHGFPSSSRMFEPLLSRLADRYHLVAPDYPGFGHSDAPNPKAFAYTFDHLATVMTHFLDQVGLHHYTLYMQDYGGPVGFRVALAHPERVDAMIVQNSVAHDTGLGARWTPLRAFWADRALHEAAFRANFLSLKTTRARHLGSDPNPDRYDPDLWTDEDAFLNRPGEADIQTDLFYDYQTNVAAYPTWQAWLKQKHPRLLVVWGKYDPSFDLSEPQAFKQDVPDAEVHLFDAGHFALDTAAEPIATIIRGFVHGK
jgi:pimeloyl-ACP methyl ester carboxylesterase